MTTVLITGSEGNLGQYLVRRLRVSRPNWKILRIKHQKDTCIFDTNKDRYEGDLRDPALMKKIFSEHRVDYLIHAASQSYRHAGYREHPFQVLENDSSSLLNLLSHSKSVHKIIYLSSALMYEHATHSTMEEATVPMAAPTSSYGVAKYFGENMIRAFGLEYNIAFTIWRPFNIVSPLEPHDGEGRHVFVDFFRRLLIEQVSEFGVIGSGEQVRCFIWVEDAARCIIDNIDNEKSNGEIFNLSRNEPMSLLQLKELLLELGREAGVVTASYNPPTIKRDKFSGIESKIRIPSINKLKDILGWDSDTTVRDCFKKFIKEKFKNDN